MTSADAEKLDTEVLLGLLELHWQLLSHSETSDVATMDMNTYLSCCAVLERREDWRNKDRLNHEMAQAAFRSIPASYIVNEVIVFEDNA